MPVYIKGKEYYTVPERVKQAHAENAFDSLETNIVKDNDKEVVFKATVVIKGRAFTGTSASNKNKNSIEGQNPYEVAETSAIGRALGFAGFGLTDTIASADEIVKTEGTKKESKESTETFTCERVKEDGTPCGVTLVALKDKSPSQLAKITKANFGLVLCHDCAKEALGARGK